MNNIKKYRNKFHLSQKQLSEKIGVKQNTISEWENDKKMPNIRKAMEIANIFKTTIEELYK